MRPLWSRVGPNDRRPWKERRGHRCVRVRRRRPREERAGDQRDAAVSQGTCWPPPDPGTDEKGFLPRQGASPADAGLGRPASGPTRECVSVSSRCVVMTALDGNTEGARSWGQGPRRDPTEAARALGAAAQAPGDGSGPSGPMRSRKQTRHRQEVVSPAAPAHSPPDKPAPHLRARPRKGRRRVTRAARGPCEDTGRSVLAACSPWTNASCSRASLPRDGTGPSPPHPCPVPALSPHSHETRLATFPSLPSAPVSALSDGRPSSLLPGPALALASGMSLPSLIVGTLGFLHRPSANDSKRTSP